MKETPRTVMFNTFAIEGMSLRDYFAAKAMQGIISNSDARSTWIEEIDNWIGNYAYIVADAMMEARNVTK